MVPALGEIHAPDRGDTQTNDCLMLSSLFLEIIHTGDSHLLTDRIIVEHLLWDRHCSEDCGGSREQNRKNS